MTVTDQIEDHQARCLPHVLSLRMLARDALEAPLSLLAVAEVIRATEAILAEAETAAREARAAAGSGPGLAVFLGARLSRLAVAADAMAREPYWAGLTSIFLTASFFSTLRPTLTVRMPS